MAHGTPTLASYKRIILCADGTWLASDIGNKSVPSNVAKLARAIANNGPDAQGNLVKQIVSYHSGLGSGDLPFQKAIYGAVGWGLDTDVCQIYDFISNNYEAGDELFFFGFSRGAFTVRSVAGLVANVGVLLAQHMPLFPEMWKAYRAHKSSEPFTESAWYKNNKEKLKLKEVRIKVVGVWDTVGALGIPEWPAVSWLTSIGLPINKEYAFHDTKVSQYIDYAFQALAIDEKRLTFPPTLWHATEGRPAKQLLQCWFPGVHGNIGGQAEDPRDRGDLEEIGDITFAWMLDNLSGMLTFEAASIDMLVQEHQFALNTIDIKNGWGCGPIVDNFSGLQGAFFRLLGKKYRTPGSNSDKDTAGATMEFIHPVTRIRKAKLQSYNPVPLQGFQPTEPDGSAGWKWVKTGMQAIPEYVMRPEKTMNLAYQDKGNVKYRDAPSLSRLLCPKSILADLDRDNGINDSSGNSST